MLALLVEDEELLRSLLMESLEEEGWQVVACETAEAALIFEGSSPAVMVTDVNLGPGLDGVNLTLRASQKWPHLGVVIMSGRPLPRGLVLKQNQRFIPKPFSFSLLLSCMHDVIYPIDTELDSGSLRVAAPHRLAGRENLVSEVRP